MKYEVYLTKSHEVADIIATTFHVGEYEIKSVASGISTFFKEIPAVYQSDSTYCCVVSYGDEANVEPYRIVIA